MARRRSIAENGVSLFPFMSILACLIGILTLLISVISRLDDMESQSGRTEEDLQRAMTRRDLVREARRLEQEIEALDKQVKKERASAAELERLKDREIVLREKLADLSKTTGESDAELQKIAENLKLEVVALRREQPQLRKRVELLRKQLKDRKEAPEPPQSVVVRPGGTGLHKASNIFFVECHSTGITILGKDGQSKKIPTGTISKSGDYKDFLARVKSTRNSMVLYLIRKAGNEAYLWAANEAREKFDVNTGSLPLPNDGPIDLSLFD